MNDLDVKKIRLNLGVSQEKLAEMLDVSLRTVQNWEANETSVSFKNCTKLRNLIASSSQEQNSQEQNSERADGIRFPFVGNKDLLHGNKDFRFGDCEPFSGSRDKEVEYLRQQVADKERVISSKEKVISSKEKVISLLEQQVADKNEIIALLKQKTASEHSRPDVPISPFAVADIKEMI